MIEALLASGVLTGDEVFSDTFIVEHRTGRNSLTLIQTSQQTLALKAFASEASRVRELGSLEALHGATLSGAFAVPLLVEVRRKTLLTRTEPGLRSIGSRRSRHGGGGDRLAQSVATRVAAALAALHTMPIPNKALPAPLSVGLGGVGPWILDAPQTVRDLVGSMQHPPLLEALSGLEEDLSAESNAFVHGDIRAGNVLSDDVGALWIIDWETAGTGSATLDLAALVALVLEIAVTAGQGPPRPVLIRSALGAYREATGAHLDVLLTTRAAGARLLQSAVERALQENETSPHTRAIFTLGRHLILRPLEGATRIGAIK